MYNLCIRMVADRTEAEDLLQEAFIKAFRQLHSFRWECTPGAWLRKIVTNHCLNHLRKRKISFCGLEEVEGDHYPDDFMEESEITPEMVHESIKNLPEGCRVVFVLYQTEGYRHKDIAEMLNISESTSKSQYQRARMLLKEKLIHLTYEDRA